jgi:hypothetical protein
VTTPPTLGSPAALALADGSDLAARPDTRAAAGSHGPNRTATERPAPVRFASHRKPGGISIRETAVLRQRPCFG